MYKNICNKIIFKMYNSYKLINAEYPAFQLNGIYTER